MGYKETGEPVNITFIGKPFTEADLLRMGAAFEKKSSSEKRCQRVMSKYLHRLWHYEGRKTKKLELYPKWKTKNKVFIATSIDGYIADKNGRH